MIDLLQAALTYAARGWDIFPCHTPTPDGCSCRLDCGRIGKHPRTQHGLKDATIDEVTIRRWWQQWPQANIAIATGIGSGVVVLDEDSYKGGDTSRVGLEHTYSLLPETVQQLTGGGGVQYLFAHPGTPVKNGVETLGPGLDIRGDGGYIIVPPSLHASGRRYAWEMTHHPDETPLAPMPAWLLALCQDTTRRETPSAGEPIPQGRRNQTLFQLGCKMRTRGFSEAAIAGALMAINTTQCQPPLDDAEVATIAASCAKYEAGQAHAEAHQRRNGRDTGAQAPGAVWHQAMTAHDFLLQEEADVLAHVKDVVVPGCITEVSAPRASGKSLVALYLGVALSTGGVFRDERLTQRRVLLVDRDNPPSLIRKRLRWLGAHQVTTLKVLMRDKAPALTDKAAWAQFPAEDYDVVIIDSLGAATEGVSEKEGRQTQEFLATLKDLARRGPALLCLDNTIKAGTNYRGRGEKGDAVDIPYEARNVTGWTPSHAGEWWEQLPDFGEHTWQQRTTRRKGQAVMRVAFIPTKYRLGIEPAPFILEIDTRQEPWTLADVTADIATAKEQAAQEVSRQQRAKIAHAEAQLIQAIVARSPDAPLLKEEAVILLCGCGLTRKTARTLLESGGNRDVYPQGQWTIRPIAGHPSGKALGVYPAGEENDGGRSNVIQFPRQYTPIDQPPSAVGSVLDGERSASFASSDKAGVNGFDLSPQQGNYTAEGDTHPDEQLCGDFEVDGPSAGLLPSSAALDDRSVDTKATDISHGPQEVCSQGGAHNWILRRSLGDQLCARCNTTRPLREGCP
jgi:hypothetical protein